MEPQDEKPGNNWHAYTIYIQTDEPYITLLDLDNAVNKDHGIYGQHGYVWYDGDLWHVEEPDLSNWDEIVERQRGKMSQSGVSSFQKSLSDTGIGNPPCDKTPQETPNA